MLVQEIIHHQVVVQVVFLLLLQAVQREAVVLIRHRPIQVPGVAIPVVLIVVAVLVHPVVEAVIPPDLPVEVPVRRPEVVEAGVPVAVEDKKY